MPVQGLWLIGLSRPCSEAEMTEALDLVNDRLRFSHMSRGRRVVEDILKEGLPLIEDWKGTAELSGLRDLALFGRGADLRARYDCGFWLAGGSADSDPGDLPQPWLVHKGVYYLLDESRPLASQDTVPPGMRTRRYISAEGDAAISVTRIQADTDEGRP
jgi:hypothetical protein